MLQYIEVMAVAGFTSIVDVQEVRGMLAKGRKAGGDGLSPLPDLSNGNEKVTKFSTSGGMLADEA